MTGQKERGTDRQRINRKDLILIAALILVALIAAAAMQLSKKEAAKVVITRDGQVYGTYELNQDQVIYIPYGEDGGGGKSGAGLSGSGSNTVKIENGTVFMSESTCVNQICVHSLPLSKGYPGEIVCLPHQLLVELRQ